MRIWQAIALFGILTWGVPTVQQAAAETGTGSENSPVVKRTMEIPTRDAVNQRIAIMARKMELTPEQLSVIKVILVDEFNKFKEIRGEGGKLSDEQRAKIRELREETAKKIKPLLTAEQQIKFDDMTKEAKERRNKKDAK